MIVEREGRFYIGSTEKWFGTRAKAEAFVAKHAQAPVSSAPAASVLPAPSGFSVGADVYERGASGAREDEFGGVIVAGPRARGGFTQWKVEFDDGEGGVAASEWISEDRLLLA